MSEIKQVWGIIKDYKCTDLKMVQDPALAVFQHQQTIIDNLKAQLNSMDACYIEKKKECEELQERIDETITQVNKYRNIGLPMLNPLLGDIEKALRGGHE